MSLSPEARALFDRAREAGAPSAADRARLFDRLEKLTAPKGAPPPAAVPPASAGTLAAKALLVVFLAAALLSPLFSAETARAPERAAAPAPLSSEPVSPPPDEPRHAPVVELDDAIIVLDERVEAREAAPASRPADRGDGGELALLRQAQAARREGRFADALRTLDRHARRFPEGVLATERDVARALVLCESGRRDEGRHLAARFDDTAYTRSLVRACSEPAEENATLEATP